MSSFTEPLTVTDLGKGRWRLEKGFRYYIGCLESTDYIDVPAGYITDFYSVPKPFQWLLPKAQHGNQSAVLHDFLCTEGKRRWKESADIFNEAMGVLNVKPWRRTLIYNAVLLYGKVSGKKW